MKTHLNILILALFYYNTLVGFELIKISTFLLYWIVSNFLSIFLLFNVIFNEKIFTFVLQFIEE